MSEDKRKAQRELAYEMYVQNYKYQDIADEVGVSLSTIKSWATRYWKKKKVANKSCNQINEEVAKKVATPKKYKRGMHPNSRNGTGPPGNKNAEKHGFYSKVFPEEAYELLEETKLLDPIEILWTSIQTQFLAILRAQKLMYVKNQEDATQVVTMEGDGVTAYQIQHAWDKHANFLQAQARAIQTLNNSIKQYDELMRSDLATEEQKARIELLKAKVDSMTSNDMSESLEKLDTLLAGIGDIANDNS